MPENTSNSLQAIPPNVAAQIKSSITINSLSDVVLGLLRNSLDAGATSIEISLSFTHGSCSCEDDGEGINPEEFEKDGLLGVAGSTSKLDRHDTYGYGGEFLASTSALAKTTILSCRSGESLSMLALRAGKERESLIPAPSHYQLNAGESCSGTRVIVTDLFSAMPVRPKQQALLGETDRMKAWDDLLNKMTAFLLAWHQPLRVTLREDVLKREVVVDSRTCTNVNAQKFNIDLMFKILSQTSLVLPTSKASFVPIAASNSQMKMKGVISLDPAPTKQLQFVSIGIAPTRAIELLDVINRVFNDSCFGMVAEGPVEESEKKRRKGDRRFKMDGFTGAQLRNMRKGTDRWPVLVLRVLFRNVSTGAHAVQKCAGGELLRSSLESLIDVVGRAVTEWLQRQNFRPHKWRSVMRPRSQSVKINHRSVEIRSLPSGKQVQDSHDTSEASKSAGPALGNAIEAPLLASRPSFLDAATLNSSKVFEQRLDPRSLSIEASYRQENDLLKLSRNTRPDDGQGIEQKGNGYGTAAVVPESNMSSEIKETASKAWQVREDSQSIEEKGNGCGTAAVVPESNMSFEIEDTATKARRGCKDADVEANVAWIDSTSGEKYVLNTRSGMVRRVEPVSLLRTRKVESDHGNSVSHPRERLKVRADSSWVTAVVQRWDNPVFRPNSAGIPIVPNQSFAYAGKPTSTTTTSVQSQYQRAVDFSIDHLRRAKSLSQVDGKFILVKVDASSSSPSLALIDQHAASERVTVEKLFSELCQPTDAEETDTCQFMVSSEGNTPGIKCLRLAKPLRINIPRSEMRLCKAMAAYFARWGVMYIVYEETTPVSEQTLERAAATTELEIIGLPSLVAERYIADPTLLTAMIRSALHEAKANNPQALGSSEEFGHAWLRRISDCPRAIVEALNSRACRSAIMFNDVLAREDCKRLIEDLTRCAFPLVCAHGRPSVVSLVKWSSDSAEREADNHFEQAMRTWMSSRAR